MKRLILTICLCILFVAAGSASAIPVVPDNGSGTADLPIHLSYPGMGSMYITDGLPAGTNITISVIQTAPTATVEVAGGSLSGTQSVGIGSGFSWGMSGTGTLAGFNRNIFVPFSNSGASFPAPPGAGYEVHAAPRTLSAPIQSFDTDMFRLFGQLPPGDPDFDLLRITAGTDFGLPSPGHTTLTQSGGNWAVDSFFDITYRIDFVGAPGGSLAGRSGSTTNTVRLAITPEPATMALLGFGSLTILRKRRK
jgi:hypothetical protein